MPGFGGNVIALYFAAFDRGYSSARWATYKQWATLGAQVRRGERGTRGIVWNITERAPADQDDTDGDAARQRTAWARAFTVFNAVQVENDPAADIPPASSPLERDARADVFFAAIPAVIHWGAGNPCYRPSSDDVLMPSFDTFHTNADAYGTLAHDPLTAPVR